MMELASLMLLIAKQSETHRNSGGSGKSSGSSCIGGGDSAGGDLIFI